MNLISTTGTVAAVMRTLYGCRDSSLVAQTAVVNFKKHLTNFHGVIFLGGDPEIDAGLFDQEEINSGGNTTISFLVNTPQRIASGVRGMTIGCATTSGCEKPTDGAILLASPTVNQFGDLSFENKTKQWVTLACAATDREPKSLRVALENRPCFWSIHSELSERSVPVTVFDPDDLTPIFLTAQNKYDFFISSLDARQNLFVRLFAQSLGCGVSSASVVHDNLTPKELPDLPKQYDLCLVNEVLEYDGVSCQENDFFWFKFEKDRLK